MRAAAEHLTPVTLELGGKSPVYVDADANLDVAATRIAWGKTANNGQTCIAPDYVLVHKSVKDQFVKKISEKLTSWWGPNAEANPNYSRIINSRHAARIAALINESKQRTLGATNACMLKVQSNRRRLWRTDQAREPFRAAHCAR